MLIYCHNFVATLRTATNLCMFFYMLYLFCMHIFIVQCSDQDFRSMRYIKIDIIIIIFCASVRTLHSFEQHNIHQVHQRASCGERTTPDLGVSRGMHPRIPQLEHRDETSVSRVHDSLAAESHKVMHHFCRSACQCFSIHNSVRYRFGKVASHISLSYFP